MLPWQGPLDHRERRKPSTPAASNSPSLSQPERAAVAAAAACRGPQAQLELQSNPFAPPCRGGDQIVTAGHWGQGPGTPTLQCCKQYRDAYCELLLLILCILFYM